MRTGHIAARASTALVSPKTSVRARALVGRRTKGCDGEWRMSEVNGFRSGDESNERISFLLYFVMSCVQSKQLALVLGFVNPVIIK